MQNILVGDYPPVPECFSHLISNSNENGMGFEHFLQSSHNHFNSNAMTDANQHHKAYSSSSNNASFQLQGINSSSALDAGFKAHIDQSIESQYSHHKSKEVKASDLYRDGELSSTEFSGASVGGTFGKLNSSLGKLQKEMKELRSMDISLFHQLLVLNEAIQDFKLNASDRYSESGSEYSLGTASYMGSMSSLNEESESDWAEDGPHSPLYNLENQILVASPMESSTSELLMQINDLALRADQDF